MFELEQSIAGWRRQMLAAGIQTPVPLEELEIHLREEITQQAKFGLCKEAAFNLSVKKVGSSSLLNEEFGKSVGGAVFSPESPNLFQNYIPSLNCILGLGWLTFYANILRYAFIQAWHQGFIKFWDLPNIKSWIGIYIFLSGTIGSILLILNLKLGQRIVRTNALVFVFLGLMAYAINFGGFNWYFGAFCVVSICLLHLPRPPKIQTAN